MLNKFLYTIIFCLLYPCIIFASNTGFAFLNIPANAKSIALGGNNTTMINDAGAVFLNQSSLAFLTQHNINFNSLSFFDGIEIYTLSYAYKGNNFNQAIGIKNLKNLSVDRTLIEGQVPVTGLGSADYYDRQFMYAISRKIDNNSAIGLGMSYYTQKIDNIKTNNMLFDLGYKKIFSKDLIYGLSVKNLGKSPTIDKEKSYLPNTISTGLYYRSTWLPPIIIDFFKQKNDNIHLSLSTVINFEEYFQFYIGWRTDNDIKDSISMGLSVLQKNYIISYGFKNQGGFGDIHSFNISFYFDKKDKSVTGPESIKPVIEVSKDDMYFQFLKTAQNLYENKKYVEAINYYKKAVDIKSDYNIGIYKRIADIFFILKEYEKAEEYYNIYRTKIIKE